MLAWPTGVGEERFFSCMVSCLTSLTVMEKLDGSAMTWKPPWVLYTSLGRFPPGELSIMLVISLIRLIPSLLLQLLMRIPSSSMPKFCLLMVVEDNKCRVLCPRVLVQFL